jgi:hypothetical protein
MTTHEPGLHDYPITSEPQEPPQSPQPPEPPQSPQPRRKHWYRRGTAPVAAVRPYHGLAIAGFAVSIVGVIFGLIPILFLLAWAGGALGVTFGILGRKWRIGKVAIALSVAALALGVAGVVIVNNATTKLNHDLNSLAQPVATAPPSAPATVEPPTVEPPTAEPPTVEPPPVATPTAQAIPNSMSVSGTDPTTNTVSRGTVAVLSASNERSATNEFGDVTTAKNGYFVTFTVRYTLTGGTLDYNEWDWYVIGADGARTSIQDGNSTMYTVVKNLKTLSADTLHMPGEYVQATVTFDVASTHGQLVYTPHSNTDTTPLGIWNF